MNKTIKTTPVPVRLDCSVRDRLQDAANKLGTTISGVIRFSIVQQLQQIESGVIRLANMEEAK